MDTMDTMHRLEVMVEHIVALAHAVKEIQIIPLENESLGPVLLALQQARLGVEVMDSEGQIKLKIWAQECEL